MTNGRGKTTLNDQNSRLMEMKIDEDITNLLRDLNAEAKEMAERLNVFSEYEHYKTLLTEGERCSLSEIEKALRHRVESFTTIQNVLSNDNERVS
jgi:hypothetical protein